MSDVHLLASRHYPVCQRGDVTVFLLRYDNDVGDVISVRLWHDCSGSSPSWKVVLLLNHFVNFFVFMSILFGLLHTSFVPLFKT